MNSTPHRRSSQKMTSGIRALDDYLEIVERCVLVLLFSILVLLIVANIVFRNFFQLSFSGLIEITPVLVLWISLVGSTLALKTRRHIKMDILLRFFSKRLCFAAAILVDLSGMSIMAILFFSSVEFVQNEIDLFGAWGVTTLIFPFFFSVSFFRFFSRITYQVFPALTIEEDSRE